MEGLVKEGCDLPEEHQAELAILAGKPESKRIKTEIIFLQIKEYQRFQETEKQRLGKRFRKCSAVEKFCGENNIATSTFRAQMKKYNEGGISALVPKWGEKKKEGFFTKEDIESIRELIDPTIGYTGNHRKIVFIYKSMGVAPPSYVTFRRAAITHDLIQLKGKKAFPKTGSIVAQGKMHQENPELKLRPDHNIAISEWFRVVDKRAFNLAIFHYATILPFLDPNLDLKKKRKLVDEITGRTFCPLPGVSVKIAKSTLYRRIAGVKKHGFDYLIPKHSIRKTPIHGNKIEARIEIDLNHPLVWLSEMKDILTNISRPFSKRQKSAIEFLDIMTKLSSVSRTNPVKFVPYLSDEEIRNLEKFRKSTHKHRRERATAILMAYRGHTMFEICLTANRPRPTIYAWIKKFKERGLAMIEGRKDMKKNNPELKERPDRIVKIIHHPPKDYAINRSSWTLESIADVYEKEYGKKLSIASIARAIKKTDYTWRRARTVLTSNDPNYKIKVSMILETLRNMGPDETFFFVDEAGPWQVKKYGGKSLTEKGTIKVVPQFQKPKGRVTFIGALDAVKNQVTFFFTKSKDTDAVIQLIKILFYKYHDRSKLHLTWDCASWHRSRDLQRFIDQLNGREDGPMINSLLLPKRCQFLNVIESVFSGLKKAVILNSDYKSEYEMKVAIAQHFYKRNREFRENPKRAGKKIWDPKYFESGLHKKM